MRDACWLQLKTKRIISWTLPLQRYNICVKLKTSYRRNSQADHFKSRVTGLVQCQFPFFADRIWPDAAGTGDGRGAAGLCAVAGSSNRHRTQADYAGILTRDHNTAGSAVDTSILFDFSAARLAAWTKNRELSFYVLGSKVISPYTCHYQLRLTNMGNICQRSCVAVQPIEPRSTSTGFHQSTLIYW